MGLPGPGSEEGRQQLPQHHGGAVAVELCAVLPGVAARPRVLIDIGILMFSLAVLFQLVTLPVEFNASARALQLLESEGFLYGDENRQARKVLSAAAMTYVAAAATAILQLLRLIYLFGGRRRD